jgi:membrane associated rhomboid family serine protease
MIFYGQYVEAIIGWKRTFMLFLLTGTIGSLTAAIHRDLPSI